MSTFFNDSLSDFTSLLHTSDLKEEPVDLDTFVQDPYFLNFGHAPLSPIQKELALHMSQVYLPHTLKEIHGNEMGQHIWDKYTVNEVICMAGKGGGKDHTSRISFLYAIYLIHCLKDPIKYYGKAGGTYIDMLNIAVNADQARNVFFEPLKNIMHQSVYFREMGANAQKNEIRFDSSPVRLFSGNSEAEAWEGLDLLLVVLDEIAAFKVDSQFKGDSLKSRLSASSIYQMSKNSVISRFPKIGKCILLSFTRYKGDFIMQRFDEAANEPGVYRLKAKTWEMNPTIKREDLEPQYIRNPVESKARFECEPPEMVDAYFRDPDRVRQCFKGDWITLDAGTNNERRKLMEIPDLFPYDEYGRLKDWFRCNDDYTRYIHVDLALRHDRASLSMVHIPGTRRVETYPGVYENLPVVKMDIIRYWEAQEGKEIDFNDIREFIVLLCKKFPVGMVTFDQWQSSDMIQTLQRRGIRADTHSVRTSDYDTLLTCFYDGRFSGYYVDLLVEEELLKLQILSNGKIDHPAKNSKDLADSLAGAVYMACEAAEFSNEIDIEILGLDEDPLEAEMEEAILEEREKQISRRVYSSKVEIDGIDFNFEAI